MLVMVVGCFDDDRCTVSILFDFGAPIVLIAWWTWTFRDQCDSTETGIYVQSHSNVLCCASRKRYCVDAYSKQYHHLYNYALHLIIYKLTIGTIYKFGCWLNVICDINHGHNILIGLRTAHFHNMRTQRVTYTHTHWVRHRQKNKRWSFLTWHWMTTGEWIAGVATKATTHWRMIDHVTNGREATWSRTWVNAALIDTSKFGRAFGADRTLGTAIWCTAHVIGQAGTGRCIANFTAYRIWTAGWWYAWIVICNNWWWSFYFVTLIYCRRCQLYTQPSCTQTTERHGQAQG